MAENNSEDEKDIQPKTTTVWEWAIAALGLILVSGAVGFIIFNSLKSEPTPPQISVTVDSIAPSGEGFLVKFLVKNSGNQTAAAVTIEGELKNGEEKAETSSATLTYAPANSERRGGLYFTKNPQQFDFQLRATGYEEP